jgi:hypothetical protein
MNIIERLKQNKEAYGLMPEELRRVAEKIGKNEFKFYSVASFGQWSHADSGDFIRESVYRLRANYVCDHPHTREQTLKGLYACDWCDVCVEPPKPEMGWVEYHVVTHGGQSYVVEGLKNSVGTKSFLIEATGMVGFGGIKYKSPCGCTCSCIPEDTCFYMFPAHPCETHGPAVPVAVRFWEVKR